MWGLSGCRSRRAAYSRLHGRRRLLVISTNFCTNKILLSESHNSVISIAIIKGRGSAREWGLVGWEWMGGLFSRRKHENSRKLWKIGE